MVDLNKFCGGKGVVYDLAKPWSEGDWTYASDENLLIKVQRVMSIPERGDAPVIAGSHLDIDIQTLTCAWEKVPVIKETTCTKCGGSGNDPLCPECDGDGKVEWFSGYSDYVCECQTYGGDGKTRQDEPECCEYCHGSGMVPVKDSVRVGDVYVSTILLRKIFDLPGVEVAQASDHMVAFRFAGGSGLINKGWWPRC